MVFAKQSGQDHRTQEDIVRAKTRPANEIIQEDLELPGLARLHLMDEKQMIEFFTMVLKSRQGIRELEVVLGDQYPQREKLVSLPDSNRLAALPPQTIARIFAFALLEQPAAIGFKAVMEIMPDNSITSRIYIKELTSGEVTSPTQWDMDGKPVDGDKEYCPRLTVTYLRA